MKNTKLIKRSRLHAKIRTRVSGTKEIPRLSIFRSNISIYAQLINDDTNTTIGQATSATMKGKKTKVAEAIEVGKEIAKVAASKGITKVVFDRGGFKFAGRVKALADSARESGLVF
jgi:large subunit ribosomal protein L18